MNSSTKLKIQQIIVKTNNYIDDCCFDIQGMSSSHSLMNAAESQMARILTKIVVGAASIWWSTLELKEFIKTRKIQKGL
jgi:hypothetical protein